MDFNVMITLIGAICAISGMLLGWIGRTKAFKDEVAQEATADASLQTDVSYIKSGILDIRVDLRDIGRRMDDFSERLTRVEESAKQAHKRLDEIKKEG
ncbi:MULTISPECIES: hypothetical protein [Paenibacillus]|uniref:hypothetical protein n=1 Tax=Paenibacillus TaxID=44249 RepID=UPI00119E8507|nr:hypothetical protein [Paenibacillus sp. IHBB 10380]